MASWCFCALRCALTVTHSAPPRRSHNFTTLSEVCLNIMRFCCVLIIYGDLKAVVGIRRVYFDVKIAEWVELERVTLTMCISTLGAIRATQYCAVAYIYIIYKRILKH